jgi:dTDP-4-dehydrorhamnose reductase
MTTLITGGRGALGREFGARLPSALAPSSSELDVRDETAVSRFVSDNGVDRVVHCAARTAVRYCEENRADAFATNVQGTRNLCSALSSQSGPTQFTYISTACVFAGDDPDASYSEDDIPGPKNFYGLSKLLAEYVVLEWSACCVSRSALVVRTNFADRGLWKHPSAFVDRFGTYLYPDLVASKAIELLDAGETGLIHVCGDRRLSMLEFARLSDPGVGAMSLTEYAGPPVTVNMSLTSNRIAPLTLG